MHIRPFQNRSGGDDTLRRRREDLAHLLEQPTDSEVRPCPGCRIPCACVQQSPTCCCGCSPNCPNASEELSTDPVKYPVEAPIVPLVYGLTSLRVVETCWSCGGHRTTSDSALKLPQVWINPPAGVYSELIAQHLANLRRGKKLNHQWEVAVNPFQLEGAATTYVIKPNLTGDSGKPDMTMLQRDLIVIAEALQLKIKKLATVDLDELKNHEAA